MQVSKCGNSLAVRLPAAVVEALDLKEGDEIEISIAHHPGNDRRERFPVPRFAEQPVRHRAAHTFEKAKGSTGTTCEHGAGWGTPHFLRQKSVS